MRIKIKPTDSCCQYIVNKEKGKVVCVIHNTKCLLENFICDFDSDFVPVVFWKDVRLPNQFSGVATCADGDEWNEELGRRIAFARAKYKLDRSFFKRANKFINDMDKRVDRLYTEFNDYGAVISKHHNNRVKRLMKDLGDDFVLYKND